MPPLRVLWLSNKVHSRSDGAGTGSWLEPMAQALVRSGEVQLGNIAQGPVSTTTRQDCGPVQQWVVPRGRSGRDGLPASGTVAQIAKAVDEFSPDLIHVWGTEGYWGLLTARGLLQAPALLEMQGLKRTIAEVFSGGLSLAAQLACVGLKEVLRQTSIPQRRNSFAKWGVFEEEIVAGHRFISTQSTWTEAQVRAMNDTCQVFHTSRLLRAPSYSAAPWQPPSNAVVFCSAADPAPYKGLHVAIRAMSHLVARFPEIRLRIAGAHQRPGIRRDGYVAWLDRQIARLQLGANVVWLGPLTAPEIAGELCHCSAVVIPSFVESYCVALAEALFLGAPAVVSYTGGTAHLAGDEETALFFPPGDDAMCAYQLERTISDERLASRLSRNARDAAVVICHRQRIVQNQLAIYRQMHSAVAGVGGSQAGSDLAGEMS